MDGAAAPTHNIVQRHMGMAVRYAVIDFAISYPHSNTLQAHCLRASPPGRQPQCPLCNSPTCSVSDWMHCSRAYRCHTTPTTRHTRYSRCIYLYVVDTQTLCTYIFLSVQKQLERLWEAAFPEEPFGGHKCARWRDMGWQNDNPASDFRGGGLLSLEALNYLATHHRDAFETLLHKRNGHRSDWEYPFGAAGVNLVFALTQTLGLRGEGVPTVAAGRHFCALLVRAV